MRTVAIIPARGGSKGIPRKNVVEVCGKPLIAWSIEQARSSRHVESVWVTSDNAEILQVSARFGAHPILRPEEISGDTATSESAWLHALETIEAETGPVDLVVAMQATSPIRDPDDIDSAIETLRDGCYDTLLSVSEIQDFFMWRKTPEGLGESVNYDWRDRRRRQAIEPRFLENGSLYLFKPAHLRETGNRLGGRIGFHLMRRHTMFQVDEPGDLHLVEGILRGFQLDR